MNTPHAHTDGFEVVQTRAGHRAMLDHMSGEVMHPILSPAQEAEQLYATPARLAERLAASTDERRLQLLDVGLGAGSNASHAFKVARAAGRKLDVVSFDRSAAALALAASEAHAQDFAFDPGLAAFASTAAQEGYAESTMGTWRVVVGDLCETLPTQPPDAADVVFWDLFSRRRNPALWSVQIFASLRRACRSGATVHTYSGATATRTAMLLGGFCVGLGDRLDRNKRATTAAVDLGSLTEPLQATFLDRLTRSTAPFPEDAPADALQRLATHRQFRRV